MEIWPLVTSYMRMSSRSSVDLPLPEGPTTARELPAGVLLDPTFRVTEAHWAVTALGRTVHGDLAAGDVVHAHEQA